uniref:translocation/assembly module TamB domain-containing protein n=1 Tax=Elioraea tepidiphila TaxID=457934 RepID=UPI002FD9DB03
VFVRGRGVDAELGGSVRLGGTAAAPDLTGAFGLRRGEISILAQRIAFRRGALDFDGAAGIDPALDFEAATTAGDITAIVRVGGTATAPRITLGSEPEVPQDEVLARLLFGRSQATLTPVQLLQLAQAAAELTGVGPSGPGILDRVRRGLGLDRLTVGTDQATGGPTVEAGRYLADGVYLGARRTADGSTRATVQIEVLPNVRAEADVGGEGEGRVGLSWGIDY